MRLRTNERFVDMAWVREAVQLIILDEHPDDEMVTVEDTHGAVLFVVSFRTLKELSRMEHTARRISNNYEHRRAIINANLAAGGNPG